MPGFTSQSTLSCVIEQILSLRDNLTSITANINARRQINHQLSIIKGKEHETLFAAHGIHRAVGAEAKQKARQQNLQFFGHNCGPCCDFYLKNRLLSIIRMLYFIW
jgi:hypothetical protein